MAIYLGIRIIQQKLKYKDVVAKWPQFKEGIDAYLEEKGWHINKKGICVHK